MVPSAHNIVHPFSLSNARVASTETAKSWFLLIPLFSIIQHFLSRYFTLSLFSPLLSPFVTGFLLPQAPFFFLFLPFSSLALGEALMMTNKSQVPTICNHLHKWTADTSSMPVFCRAWLCARFCLEPSARLCRSPAEGKSLPVEVTL